MGDDEEQLLGRARQGDEEALAELLRQQAPRLRRSLAGRIPVRWQGLLSEEDVLQETYADAFLEIGRFVPTGPGALGAWLARMAQNNLADALRYLGAQRRGGGATPGDGHAGAGTAEASAEALLASLTARSRSSPSRHAERGEAARLLDAALTRLPADHERVVRLYDLEGRAIEEVAGALGRSPGAAYLLRHRALSRLQRWLAPELGGESA